MGGGLVGALDGTAAHGTLGAHHGLVTFKIQDLHSELFIFGFQLCEPVHERIRLFLPLLARDSSALSVLDKTVFILWEDAAHENESLDRDSVEVDLEEADSESLLVNCFYVLVSLAIKKIRI